MRPEQGGEPMSAMILVHHLLLRRIQRRNLCCLTQSARLVKIVTSKLFGRRFGRFGRSDCTCRGGSRAGVRRLRVVVTMRDVVVEETLQVVERSVFVLRALVRWGCLTRGGGDRLCGRNSGTRMFRWSVGC